MKKFTKISQEELTAFINSNPSKDPIALQQFDLRDFIYKKEELYKDFYAMNSVVNQCILGPMYSENTKQPDPSNYYMSSFIKTEVSSTTIDTNCKVYTNKFSVRVFDPQAGFSRTKEMSVEMPPNIYCYVELQKKKNENEKNRYNVIFDYDSMPLVEDKLQEIAGHKNFPKDLITFSYRSTHGYDFFNKSKKEIKSNFSDLVINTHF